MISSLCESDSDQGARAKAAIASDDTLYYPFTVAWTVSMLLVT